LPHLLVLRGVHSDLLSFDLAAVMRKRNRMVNLFQFDDSGHVPPLMAPEQINVVNRCCSMTRVPVRKKR
jgi:pimeloyl-ACP methyl ester carboxylesterase